MSDAPHQNNMTAKQRAFFLLRFLSAPFLFVVAGVTVLALLGMAQRIGWISAAGENSPSLNETNADANADYICPMMCTPGQKEPGRCPVCAMELVLANSGTRGDGRSIVVDPATRRVANIQTAIAQRMPIRRTIHAVGEVGYDEGKMKTISAYTTGRFDKMYVDYVGAVVEKGDRLAEFYSPELHSAQVEYLQAMESLSRSDSLDAVQKANRRLRANARQRLIELGMLDEQVDRLAETRKAMNRLDVIAPMHGTVMERLAVEGEYVNEGQPVFRLADLSTVWLQLELFPDEAAAVQAGQSVKAHLKSRPDMAIHGRVAFVGPKVNSQSRTVSVRVVIDNSDGAIRIGDYAKATIEVPLIDSAQSTNTALVVPRSAVMSAAEQSIVYVETEAGRFEIRRVMTGPTVGQQIVIANGLTEGETVATSGNFLLDSQMQLAGNPSLIDPSRVSAQLEVIAGLSAKELAEIQQLPHSERTQAIEQRICPVSKSNLGSMGIPIKVELKGKTIFVCCEGCRANVRLPKNENY